MEQGRQDPHSARLALVLGEVARRGATGRLFLSGTAGVAGGMMSFHRGILVALIPPSPAKPFDLASANLAGARRAVLAAAAHAAGQDAGKNTPPFFTAGDLSERPPTSPHLTAGDLALDVARLVEDCAWLEDRLGAARGSRPARCAPPASPPAATLGPHDGLLLQSADGTHSLEALLSLTPLSRLDALRALFGLEASGLLASQPDGNLSDLDRFLHRTAARATASPARGAAGSGTQAAPGVSAVGSPAGGPRARTAAASPGPAGARTAAPATGSIARSGVYVQSSGSPAASTFPSAASSPGGRPAASAPAPAVPAPSTSAPADAAGITWSPEQQQERNGLRQKGRDLAGQDRYAILEVDRSAAEAAIRASYYRLARLYHPDRLRKPHLEDMQRELESMFAAITDAYNTLSHADSRAAYDQELHAATGARPREVRDRSAAARDAFLRGRKAAEEGKLYEAIRLFEVAVENDKSRAEYFHHLGACQGQNPRWRKKAEENLLTSIRMNPGSVAGYVELARLYRKGGLERRCLEMYEEALKWDPDHREARAETAAAREATGTRGLRGLFRKE